MASVRQAHTTPEIILRSALHRSGLRYRLHDPTLPGTPDLIFPRFTSVLFVHGCFWHSHGCYKSTLPKTRRAFWLEKFSQNQQRDERIVVELRGKGWRVLTVWECALLGRHALSPDTIAGRVRAWLASASGRAEIPQRPR